jgi:hypothetical protein
LLETLAGIVPESPSEPSTAPAEATWRERLWSVSPDVRLGVPEAAEAFGRPVSWVYRHTSAKSGLELLPHRRLDGELVFLAGELRAWIREHEEVVQRGPRDMPPLVLSSRKAS